MVDKFTENLNIIESLPDQPTISSNELKRQFDLAGNLIKDFLNNILLPYIDKIESNMATKDELKKIKENMSNLIKEEFQKYEEKMKELEEKVTQISSNKTDYSDFVISEESMYLSTHTQYGSDSKTTEYTKEGYKPLGLIGGWSLTKPDGSTNIPGNSRYSSGGWGIHDSFVKEITDNSITIYVKAGSSPNHGNIHDEIDVNFRILWIKIKETNKE